jgi:dTDP-4-dehydrorhamnose 3,5-epimerase
MDHPKLIPRQRFSDDRGWYEVLADPDLCREFSHHGIEWLQWNASLSTQGVLRGLHHQSPQPQAKLVRILQGEVWDVILDLRPGSATYGEWQSFELSGENPQVLYIPEGFSHGVLTTSKNATLIYAVNRPRHIAGEKIIRWDDPRFAIPWPIKTPILSERDAGAEDWPDDEVVQMD